MSKKTIKLGDFFFANCIEGNTVIIVNMSGRDIFAGRYLELPTKFYDYEIKYMYVSGGILHIDIRY